MASILLSGPAGASKSALARQILEEQPGLAAVADIQAIVVALQLLQRLADGRYPVRNPEILPLAEYVRRSILTAARERGIFTISTNSDGDAARRAFLLNLLGPGAVERVVDPGIDIVRARLADPVTGDLGDDCNQAINRWYGRL